MDITAVRANLAAACQDVADASGHKLNCFGFVPTSIPEPCFYAGEVEVIPSRTFGGLEEVVIICRVLVSIADDRNGQESLDGFLRKDGPSSIREAIYADESLGGECDTLFIESIRGYAMYEVGVDRFYGAEIVVRIWGD